MREVFCCVVSDEAERPNKPVRQTKSRRTCTPLLRNFLAERGPKFILGIYNLEGPTKIKSHSFRDGFFHVSQALRKIRLLRGEKTKLSVTYRIFVYHSLKNQALTSSSSPVRATKNFSIIFLENHNYF